MWCATHPVNHMEDIKGDIEKSVAAFSKSNVGVNDIITGINALGDSFEILGKAVKSCDEKLTDSTEMEIFIEMTEKFADATAKDLTFKIGQNVMVNGVDIYRELSAAYTNFYAKEYESFGRSIGASMALTFIGDNKDLSKEDAKTLKDMTEYELYPDGTFNKDDDQKYRDYLKYLDAKRKNPDADVQKPDMNGEDKWKAPEKRDVTEDEANKLLDGQTA